MAEHEIRIALVMNGGVSLAVWMAGVTHELDLIRRASTPGAPPAQPYDEKVAARWQQLLRPEQGYEQRRLVIDVIAGTSAGGLNGVMLATAIAHDATLDPTDGADVKTRGPWLREQWRELGALEATKLLPDNAGERTGSVLNGRFFLQEATRLLTCLADKRTPTANHPVTLFTTASGLGEQGFDAYDYAGTPFDVADHRFLYRFTTDLPRIYDRRSIEFPAPPDPGAQFGDTSLLARAARASASFPVAFAPVNEDDELNKVRPPRERPRRTDTAPSWLMDGGVLDNAPFGPVLETVSRSEVESHASRYLVYVVPSSGVGKATTAVSDDEPSWKQTAGSAIQFPREVDFRSDMEDLERLLLDADASWSDTQRLFNKACHDPMERARVMLAAEQLQPTYTRGRAAGGVWEAVTVSRSGRTTVLDKAAAVSDEAVKEILKLDLTWTPPEGAAVAPTLVATSGQVVWPWGLGPAERVTRLVLRWLRSNLADAFNAAKVGDLSRPRSVPELEDDISKASEVLRNILAVREALTPAVKAAQLTTRTPEVQVATALNRIFSDHRVPEALGQEIRRLEESIPDGADLVELALATEVVSRCTSSRTPDRRSAPFRFVRLGPDVALPVLSAPDRKLATDLGDRILYGTQVGHFGAFGAADWRRWDWLMGRLHAVAHIGTLLHAGQDAQAAEEWVGATQREVLAAENWEDVAVAKRLHSLRDDFLSASVWGGLGRMIDALNDADQDRNKPASTTTGLGDRLVHVSGGLGKRPGQWIKVVAGRETRSNSTLEQLVRWFTEPTRDLVWSVLTAGQVKSARAQGGAVALLRSAVWFAAALLGAALLLAALLGGDASWWVVVLAGLGSAALLVGLALGVLVARLNSTRTSLRDWIQVRLERWLRPQP
ncbi:MULTISPECIES: DUF3376 domain-containing protein [unclassified Kribbella]